MVLEIPDLAISLLFLFLPGVIAFITVLHLTFLKRPSPFFFSIYSVVLGFIAYLVYTVLAIIAAHAIAVLGGTPGGIQVSFFGTLETGVFRIDVVELIIVSTIAFLQGIAFSYLVNDNTVHKIANTVGLSKQLLQDRPWSVVFNELDSPWVTYRDLTTGLIYEGWVMIYSEDTDPHELLLKDVTVYRNDPDGPEVEELYAVKALLISRQPHQASIEFRDEIFI